MCSIVTNCANPFHPASLLRRYSFALAHHRRGKGRVEEHDIGCCELLQTPLDPLSRSVRLIGCEWVGWGEGRSVCFHEYTYENISSLYSSWDYNNSPLYKPSHLSHLSLSSHLIWCCLLLARPSSMNYKRYKSAVRSTSWTKYSVAKHTFNSLLHHQLPLLTTLCY